MKSDHLYLDFIKRSIEQIESYIAGKDQPLQEALYRDAVLRNLQTIAQAAMSLTTDARARYPEVEWAQLRAFRNILVHGYMEVDLSRVYEALHKSLPILKQAVLTELQRYEPNEQGRSD